MIYVTTKNRLPVKALPCFAELAEIVITTVYDIGAGCGHYLIYLSRINSVIMCSKSKNKWHLAII